MGSSNDGAIRWTRDDVWFRSGDARCAAWLYRPLGPSPAPAPCVVLAHGFGGVRTMRLDAYAERFAAAGYAALVFDYRHFGASEGEPRQLLDIGRQLEDWAAATRFARGAAGVDPARIVLWGTSFSGGHVIAIAADDPRIAAVVSQVPHTSGPAAALATGARQSLRLTREALRDAAGALLGRPPRCVPLAGAPGALAAMTAPGTLEGVERLLQAGPRPREDVAARIFLSLAGYSPGRKAARVRCPLLVQLALRDAITPRGPAERAARDAPRGELLCYDLEHFDIYVGAPFERAAADQLDFLRRHVPVSAGAGARPAAEG